MIIFLLFIYLFLVLVFLFPPSPPPPPPPLSLSLPMLPGEAGRSELVDTAMGDEERQSVMMELGEVDVEVTVATDNGVGGAKGGGSKVELIMGEESKAVSEGEEPEWVRHLRAICVILGGEKTIALHQEFLIRNNNSDLQILKNTKVCVYACSSSLSLLCLLRSSCVLFFFLSFLSLLPSLTFHLSCVPPPFLPLSCLLCIKSSHSTLRILTVH